MVLVPVLTTSLIHFSWKGWENVLFELGIERVKIQVVFFSPSRMCILIGLLDFREHMMCFFFWSRANSTARCRRCFVAEFFHVYIVFLVIAIFAKTECYSPSNLLVRSATYRTSATYQLSTCRKWYVASFHAFHDHFSHETYKHHASTVTCSESKWKNPPGQNDHSRQKQTTRWKYFFVSIIILGHEYTGSASLVPDKFPIVLSVTLQYLTRAAIGPP